MMLYLGVDVAGTQLHCVVVDAAGRIAQVEILDPSEGAPVDELLRDVEVAAIDAPAALSSAPHAAESSLSPKFRPARCAEIALGRDHGIWVPWVTPTGDVQAPRWMQVGFELFASARRVGCEAIEVFPYAGFRMLAGGGRLPPKSTRAGVLRRAELLRQAGVRADQLEMWSHDALDAGLAALIALRRARGEALAVSCGHDGSAIWLP